MTQIVPAELIEGGPSRNIDQPSITIPETFTRQTVFLHGLMEAKRRRGGEQQYRSQGAAGYNAQFIQVIERARLKEGLELGAALTAGSTVGGVLNGTLPNPTFAVDMATQAELDAHITDTSAAHAASAISYAGGVGMSATDVEAAVDELAIEKSNIIRAIRNVTTTSDTPVLADTDNFITSTNAALTTITLPLNATVAYPIGIQLFVMALGAAGVALAITATGVLNGCVTLAQFERANILKIGTNTWVSNRMLAT